MFLNPSLTFYFKMFNSPKTGIGAFKYLLNLFNFHDSECCYENKLIIELKLIVIENANLDITIL